MHIKSIFRHILLCFIVILSLTGFTSCSSEMIVEVSNVDYGFLEADQIDDFDQVVIEKAKKPTNFDVGTDYFFLLQFSLTSRSTNTDSLTFKTTIEIENSEYLNGELNYTNSGSDENNKTPLTDPESGEKGFVITATHKVPREYDETSDIKIILRMTTLTAGNTMMRFSFLGEGLTVTGDCDGLTRSLVIDKVQIEKPTLTYNSTNIELNWNHVKHADYYKIYVDGAPLISGDKQVIYETDEYVADGSEIVFFISNYISGIHRVKIQAFSNNANYLPSAYSNEVDVIF